jgi:hypothetical protein
MRTFTAKRANILDPVMPTLDKRVFNGITPKPTIVKFVKNLYYRTFSKTFGVPLADVSQYINLYLTGSLTTYQYSDTSDCDNSVIVNWPKLSRFLGEDPQEIRRAMIAMSIDHLDGTFLPGGSHPLQFFVVNEGIAPQDLYKPGLRSAYDLDTERWLVPPERDRSHNVMEDFPDAFSRAADIADKMETMLDSDDPQRATELWKQVHEKRMLDQRAGLGDYCEGNIVYKWLVHQGLVDRLRKELHLQIATHVKETVDWSGELDPRQLDNERDLGGMAVWEKLEKQITALAEQEKASIWWLRRSLVWFAECETSYNALRGWDNLQIKHDIRIPHITGEMSYYVALHEIGHAAFKNLYLKDVVGVGNSQEEEAWATHFVLENAQIQFNDQTLESMRENMSSYENIVVNSPMKPNWFQSKAAALLQISYNFESDTIILGSKNSDTSTRLVGSYDEETNTATLYEAERQWINPTYFRRLWNYSFPSKPLREVHFEASGERRKLKTIDHPWHDR